MSRQFWIGIALVLMVMGIGVACGVGDTPGVPGAPGQSLYLQHCASCHGRSGTGSWRAWFFLIRPGDLADAKRMQAVSDQYIFDLIKQGGAAIGKPGMPAFGFHLKDEEIRDLVAYVRALPR
jgi:mono/diheme cytochrome c family protein